MLQSVELIINIHQGTLFLLIQHFHITDIHNKINRCMFGFGGLGVACWPLVPKFAGSNPAEAVGFLGVKKSSARLPSEGK